MECEMNAEDKYDSVFLNILKEHGQIVPFLDAIFGFLYRRTDFYIIRENPTSQVGFLPGAAEKSVRDTFKKWQKLALVTSQENISSGEGGTLDHVIHEEEVVTTDSSQETSVKPIEQQEHHVENGLKCNDLSSITYNGAHCGHYLWSQTALEVDIEVPVPSSVCKSSDVQVDISACQLSVSIRDSEGQWCKLLDGQLSYKHLKEESIWTLSAGKHINIHLQKAGEIWWNSLLVTEEKLDLTKLDTSKHVMDLPEEDHMQVEKVMVEEERKRLGLISTEHQKHLYTLKKAWNVEGSPFQGHPFDPTVLQPP